MLKFGFSFNMKCILKPREASFLPHTWKVRGKKELKPGKKKAFILMKGLIFNMLLIQGARATFVATALSISTKSKHDSRIYSITQADVLTNQ